MIRLTKKQILTLHSQLIKVYGGIDGIRDEKLLESALESPFQFFDGKELYPSIQAKAARLCYGLIKNHAMIDGNKRIGVHAMLVFMIIISSGEMGKPVSRLGKMKRHMKKHMRN